MSFIHSWRVVNWPECNRAGYKVTVIETSDPDWWKGKCLGRIGFFPSKYVTKLQVGERPLQVTHNLQVSDGDNGLTLLRDQVTLPQSLYVHLCLLTLERGVVCSKFHRAHDTSIPPSLCLSLIEGRGVRFGRVLLVGIKPLVHFNISISKIGSSYSINIS